VTCSRRLCKLALLACFETGASRIYSRQRLVDAREQAVCPTARSVLYAKPNMRLASSLMLMVAFMSLSISLPHFSHMYARSDMASSFWLHRMQSAFCSKGIICPPGQAFFPVLSICASLINRIYTSKQPIA